MVTCKSPSKVIVAADALGRPLFDGVPRPADRWDFIMPAQLSACLVARKHQRKSYRGADAP